MWRWFVVLFAGLCAVPGAKAVSVEYFVTSNGLEQGNYVFSVAARPVTNGWAFHVTTTIKSGTIYDDCSFNLATCEHPSNSTTIHGIKNPPGIAVKKSERDWEADFTASSELLDTPDICLVFVENCHATINGKTELMPCADFYEIKLKDFAVTAVESERRLAAKKYYENFLASCGTNEILCLWFLQDNWNVGMKLTIDLNARNATTARDVYDWALQAQHTFDLTDSKIQALKSAASRLPNSDDTAGFNGSIFISLWKGNQVKVFQYSRRNAPKEIRQIYDITGAYFYDGR